MPGELIGELCEPSALVIPGKITSPTTTPTGQIWISGGKLYFATGSTIELVTSA